MPARVSHITLSHSRKWRARNSSALFFTCARNILGVCYLRDSSTGILESEMQKRLKFIFLITVTLGFLEMPSRMTFKTASATYIEGHISGGVTWELALSPYVVANDVIVDVGSTLTIESGVEVRFDGNFTFRVDGSLFATGNENNPIVFTSNKPEPAAGDWNMIEFTGRAGDSFIMSHSVVEYARRGLTIRSVGRTVIEKSEFTSVSESGVHVVGKSNIVIKENTFQSEENGVSASGTVSSGMIITNNHIVSSNGDGINLHTFNQKCHIYNITISSNVISSNGDGIHFDNRGMYGSIHDVSISENLVYSIGNGIYLYTYSWYDSVITDVAISKNTVFLNGGGSGIYINSDSAWSRYLLDVIVSDNKVSNATNGIYVCAGEHTNWVRYDATIVGNRVTNSEKGIYILGVHSQGLAGIKANITANCICYNTFGISFDTHAHNSAQYNHIYRNLHGMTISSGASVNATYNYWGDETGPYHATLNPTGTGNSVDGNGTDLDFRPFLLSPIISLNEHPVAVLQTDKNRVTTNQPVKFNATLSSDDSNIDGYFFDFGDGTNSSWITLSVIEHNYTCAGIYNASLVVVDDLGFMSDNTAIKAITVLPEKRWFDETLILISVVAVIAVIAGILIWKKVT